MSVQHDGEAVLFQPFSAYQFRKVFKPEDIETRSDCGDFVQLLFNQGACQKLKGLGTGEAGIGKEHCDFRRAFLIRKMTFREGGKFPDIVHQERIAKGSFSEEIHEPLGSPAAPDVQKTARHHLNGLFRIFRKNVVRFRGTVSSGVVFGKIEFPGELHRRRQNLSRAHASRLTCRVSDRSRKIIQLAASQNDSVGILSASVMRNAVRRKIRIAVECSEYFFRTEFREGLFYAFCLFCHEPRHEFRRETQLIDQLLFRCRIQETSGGWIEVAEALRFCHSGCFQCRGRIIPCVAEGGISLIAVCQPAPEVRLH